MNTVKVKIFVSVAITGNALAAGRSNRCALPQDEFERVLHDSTIHQPERGDVGYWIDVELPIPSLEPVIRAKVTRA